MSLLVGLAAAIGSFALLFVAADGKSRSAAGVIDCDGGPMSTRDSSALRASQQRRLPSGVQIQRE